MTACLELLAVVVGRVLGEFNPSLQHIPTGGVDEAEDVKIKPIFATQAAVARQAVGTASRRAMAVLEGDRARTYQRGRSGSPRLSLDEHRILPIEASHLVVVVGFVLESCRPSIGADGAPVHYDRHHPCRSARPASPLPPKATTGPSLSIVMRRLLNAQPEHFTPGGAAHGHAASAGLRRSKGRGRQRRCRHAEGGSASYGPCNSWRTAVGLGGTPGAAAGRGLRRPGSEQATKRLPPHLHTAAAPPTSGRTAPGRRRCTVARSELARQRSPSSQSGPVPRPRR